MKLLSVVKNIDFIKPIGLMQISSMAKQEGHKVDLVVLSKEDVFKKIESYKPDLIFYSSTTGEHKFYLELNKKIKKKYKNIFTIMGGPHATFFREILDEGANLDAICVGEGEYAFIELLEKLESNKDISNINNIVIRGGKLDGLNPLIENLDDLPFPDRELFYKYGGDESLPIINFITSRGCPYSCTYCFNQAYKKEYTNWGKVRSHSVNYVIKEILDAKKIFDFKYIRFNDDNFLLRPSGWIEEFVKRYSKEIGLPFYAHSRFDLITKKNVKLLKKAGCTTLQMSIESPNEEIRNIMLKRNMKDKLIIKASKIALEAGLSILSYTMIGLPDSCIQDDINAVDFNIKTKIPVAEFPIFNPFPKTELAELCLKKGYFNGDTKRFSMYGDVNESLLNCFTKEEENIQKNINILGPIAVKHPFLRNLIMNHLIYYKYNELFKRFGIINKMFSYPNYVYKRRYSWGERIDMFRKGFKMESKRRTKESLKQMNYAKESSHAQENKK